MISTMDEYLIHQTETTVDHVASTDINWQDRFYFNFLDRSGTFAATLGYGVFPNRNKADGFFRAVHEQKVYAVNFSRRLNHDREMVRAGSLAIDVVEPMKKWHLMLDEKDFGIRLDLEFRGRGAPYEFNHIFHRRNGRVMWNQVHYTQAGAYSGDITIAGKTITELYGIRDRSWGMRDMEQIDIWIWMSVNFDDYWLTAWHSEYANGRTICSDGAVSRDGSNGAIPLVLEEHDFSFATGSRIPTAATYILKDIEGNRLEVQAKTVGAVFHPFKPGVIDISDSVQLKKLDSTAPIFGLVQEFRVGDSVGYGITECLVAGGSDKYKENWTAIAAPHVTSGTE
jgi:hypothetical protein